MFHPVGHNIFDGIKLEPLNYYLNNGNENNYTQYPPYGTYITPEVTIMYETPQGLKPKSGTMVMNIELHLLI